MRPRHIVASGVLIAMLGTVAANLSLGTIEEFEGYAPVAYKDSGGIETACFGNIHDVIPGHEYTFDECVAALNEEVEDKVEEIFTCVPELIAQSPETQAAMISLAYNIGTTAFCKSSIADLARKNSWARSCKRISETYQYVGNKKIPGLTNRRKQESELCAKGLKGERNLEAYFCGL